MRLIGMLDSPYVRRVAICLDALSVEFTHESVSVFNHFDHFRTINPVVKAPSFVCDDGTVLMDSSLILQYAEAALSDDRTLWSGETIQLEHQYRAVGLALAACEKSAQAIYETNLRPSEKQHQPWLARVHGQLLAAYAGLEQELQQRPQLFNGALNHASIAAAIAWQFTQSVLAPVVKASAHPGLVALSARLEQHPAFLRWPPTGPGVQAR
ncbi:MAG TPA: glutathione S-transferase [Candidatus Acidoferrum sp.]|nr:glutathione S-transferase [Candidatus Acidoferrum sp.]